MARLLMLMILTMPLTGQAIPPLPEAVVGTMPGLRPTGEERLCWFGLSQSFDGVVVAHGMYQDRSGIVVRRLGVRIKSSWNGNVGTAADVVGEAKGEAFGNALHWRYVLALDVDGETYHVNFDDWVYLIDDEVLLNRSEMRKFGFRLGEVTLAFRKKG